MLVTELFPSSFANKKQILFERRF